MSDDQQPVSNEPEEVKRYLQPPNPNIEDIKGKMIQDGLKDQFKQRFGFFSVLHSNYLGDGYYSEKKSIPRDSNGKLIVQPRGIYAKSSKKGKTLDCYFDANFIKEDKDIRSLIEKRAKEDSDKVMSKVKQAKGKENFKITFKPAGAFEYKDMFYPDTINYKDPVWKEPLRGQNIDFQNRKVLTESRGIYTKPAKKGAITYEGVLFSYEKLGRDIAKKYEEDAKREIEDRMNRLKASRVNKEFKKPFVPNNISKCDTFQNNKELYSLDPRYVSELNKSFESKKKSLESLRIKKADHDKPFKPASLTKSVSLII